MNRTYFRSIVTALVMTAVMTMTSAGFAAAKTTIRFTEQGWDSVQVHNRIAGFIFENGYGYDVEYIAGDTIMLMAGLLDGACDVNMESWTENIQDIYDRGISSGNMIDLGSNFVDNWQGWLVPAFVVKGDPDRGIKPMAPDLKSVYDLARYWELFRDPEDRSKGRFYNSIPGWGVTKLNSEKLAAYGLGATFNDFITGSDAALAGSMDAAVRRGRPWVGYYWEPSWVLGKLDMIRLEEPPYSEEVWNDTRACAFKPVQVNILIHTDMLEKAPDAVEMLKNYETTSALVNEILAYMRDTEGSTDDGARWFLRNREDVWTRWVPADVAKNVKAALH